MNKQVVFWIDEELLEKLREYSRTESGSKKALSGTVNKILEKYLSNADTPKKSNTHTHETKKGIEDIMEWIGKNSPTGITKKKIEKLIQEYKGMDSRTIRKYEPLIISKLLEDGFKQHPANQELLIKYNL